MLVLQRPILRTCASGFLSCALLASVVGQTTTTTPNAPAPVKAKSTGRTKRPPVFNPTADEINEARQLLSALGYWITPTGEGEDISLRHALIAFQKLSARPRTGKLTPEELQALRQAQRPIPHDSTGKHLEVDLDRQVLFIVNEQGIVERILPVSTGSGAWFTEGGRTRLARTPQGRFQIQRKIAGWRKSALGLLYYPSYFYDGIAIHGNPAVPATPASHGCVRIPMFAAQEFFELTPVGTIVLVYGAAPVGQVPPGPCKPLPSPKQ